MKIILASANQGKLRELKAWMDEYEVLAFSEVMEPFEIIEDGSSFKQNALIKARAVYEKLEDKDAVVLSDDSGITVPSLGNIPDIYSARYAGENASSEQNLQKLINRLKENGLQKTPAYYTAAIALVYKGQEFCVHGWMYGDAIDEKRGDKGFGYDPMFIPQGFENTLGELDEEVKRTLSHRSNALRLAKKLLHTF